jgi:hypothetical protein
MKRIVASRSLAQHPMAGSTAGPSNRRRRLFKRDYRRAIDRCIDYFGATGGTKWPMTRRVHSGVGGEQIA